jgi:hypothetical protein
MEGAELESTSCSRSQVAATSVVVELTCAHKRNVYSSLMYNKLNTGIWPTYFGMWLALDVRYEYRVTKALPSCTRIRQLKF